MSWDASGLLRMDGERGKVWSPVMGTSQLSFSGWPFG